MLSQVDNKECSVILVDSILDYKRYDSKLDKTNNYVVTRRVQLWLGNMTQGWKLLVECKDGS